MATAALSVAIKKLQSVRQDRRGVSVRPDMIAGYADEFAITDSLRRLLRLPVKPILVSSVHQAGGCYSWQQSFLGGTVPRHGNERARVHRQPPFALFSGCRVEVHTKSLVDEAP